MKNERELVGTLQGFDVYVNMVLNDVTEMEVTPNGPAVSKQEQILLNGNTVAVMIPGGNPEWS